MTDSETDTRDIPQIPIVGRERCGKAAAGLKKSTANIRNNSRVAIQGCTSTRRAVFNVTTLIPAQTVEIPIVRATATKKICKKGTTLAIVKPGEQIAVLALGNGQPITTGKVWCTNGNASTAIQRGLALIDMDTVATCADFSCAQFGSITFMSNEQGFVRQEIQSSGTRMKQDAPKLICFKLQFQEGPPLWVQSSMLAPRIPPQSTAPAPQLDVDMRSA